MPDVRASVIVNNYNYGRFLGDAIESALRQDYPGTEVIVVDDGSTDDSRAVIRSFGDRIIPLLKPNGGQGSTFNAGFAISRGEIVNFLDADDVLAPFAMSRGAAALADPRVAHFHAQLDLVDRDLKPLGVYCPVPLSGGDLRARVLRYGPWSYRIIPTTGNIFARWYLERALPMREDEFPLAADGYLTAVAPLYGLVALDERPIGAYRAHDGNHYWRERIGLEDVRAECDCWDVTARAIVDHARRLSLDVDPETWRRSDWRQQVRRYALSLARLNDGRPSPSDILKSVFLDQTRLHRKAILLPLLALLMAAPKPLSIRLGLRLLAR